MINMITILEFLKFVCLDLFRIKRRMLKIWSSYFLSDPLVLIVDTLLSFVIGVSAIGLISIIYPDLVSMFLSSTIINISRAILVFTLIGIALLYILEKWDEYTLMRKGHPLSLDL